MPSDKPPKPSEDQEKLLRAVYAGNVDWMENLLKNPEVKADYVYPMKGTCLEVASRTPTPRSDQVIRFLLGKVKPNVYDIKPEPIHYAAEYGNHMALRELVRDKRTRINAEKSDGRTALHLAAMKFKDNPENYSICLELLLECPTLDINRPNKKNCTAIREAAESGGREAVVKMLELRPTGFDLDSHMGGGRTARQVILNKFPDLEQILPPVKVATPETSDPQALLLAGILNSHLEVFKGLLQQVDHDGTPIMDPNYFYRQPYRTTCVQEACSEGKPIEYLEALLRANANPNLVNVATCKAPIHVAIACMNLPVVELLLKQATLNVNIRDKHGDTPLHYVVRFIDDEKKAELLVRQMLEKGADVNLRNEEGTTAIMEAALLKTKELVRAMLPETDIEEEITDGVTLKSFIQTHLPELGDVVNVERQNTDMRNRLKRKLFLMLYAENGNSFVNDLQNSLKNDKDFKALLNEDDGKNTFLQTACSLKDPKRVVEVLLRNGVDPNRTIKENGSPPLVMAAEKKNYDVMKVLLHVATNKLDVNKMDRKGKTALHVVAKNRNLEMVVMLLNAGARMDLKNNLGKEPISTEAMKDLMDMSLQADEKMFPYDDEYRIKLCFGLFIHRQNFLPQHPVASASAQATTSAATSRQEDVEDPLLNGPAQVGNGSNNTTGNVYQNRCGAADPTESARLCYITETHREDCILKHPLVISFILLKWPKLQSYYYANVACVTLFTIFLNIFIILDCNEDLECSNIASKCLKALTTIFWAGIVVRELIQLFTSFRKYIRNKENVLDVALIACTLCSVFVRWVHEDVRLTFAVVTVLLSWSELFVVTGRMPVLSEYMEILKTVTKNFLFFLIWYSTLLVSFALCFYLLLRANSSFSTVGLSFFNVFTMMIGEVNTDNIKFDAVPFLSYSLFVAFIFLVAIVLLNLLNGLAISGIQEIKEAASLLSIRSRVRLIKDIEHSLMNIYKRRIPLVSRMFSLDRIMIFPEGETENSVYVYPNSNSYVLIGALKLKHSMNRTVLSETMKVIGDKSVTVSDGSKAGAQITAKTAIQKMQDLLQEMQMDAARSTTIET